MAFCGNSVNNFDCQAFREGTFLIGGWAGVFKKFVAKKVVAPPTSQIGLMHGPSQIRKQKHLTLPPSPPRQKKPEVKITDRKWCSYNRVTREKWRTM